MSRPGRKTPRDPRESQLTSNYDSTNGVCPYAPAGGGGPGRFTSRKPHGDAFATPFQTRTGPQAAKESSWTARLNEAFDEVGKAARGLVEDAIEIERRAENVVRAYFLARYKYVWQMTYEETGRSLKEFLDGMIQGLLMMLIVVASTTALGTAAGAAIGALFGGVGAGPGALIGAEAGLNFGVFVLNWLGIGFLIVYVAANFGEVLKLVSAGVERAWYAGKRLQSEQTDVDEGAKDIARGMAVLFRLILEGIVMYLLAKGTAAVAERLPGLIKSLKDSKLGKGFAEWVEKNHKSLIEDPKTNPKLRQTAKADKSTNGTGSEEPKRSQVEQKTAKWETQQEKPPRTVAQDREAITRLSEEAETLRKQGVKDADNPKLAEARSILEPYVKAKNWDEVVARLNVSSPKDKATFWSGEAAKAHAEKKGLVILETTPGGRFIDGWVKEKKMPELEWGNGGKDMWSRLSEKYAKGASGKVTVLQTAAKAAEGGGPTWKEVELPVIEKLMDKGYVSEIEIQILPAK